MMIAISLTLVVTHELIPISFQKNVKFKRNGIGFMGARLAELDTVENVDILILGSSRAYRAIDPRNFNEFKIFNLGSSAQTPKQSKFLIEKYIDKLNPKMILWEVHPSLFNNNGVESSIDLISNEKLDKRLIYYVLHENKIVLYISLLLKAYEEMTVNDKLAINSKKDTYISGGFVERVKNKFYKGKKNNSLRTEIELNNEQFLNFENGLKILAIRDVNILLFQAPVTEEDKTAIVNQDDIDNYFSALVLKYGLIGYRNFNNFDLNFIDSLDFYDSHHLNQNGANKLDMQIEKLLKNLNFKGE